MFSKLHDRLGTAGFAVAIVALVVALAGTAYAATKLNGTQKKEVEKIAKKFAGKTGATGATGAPGAPGKGGINGSNGSNGAPGANGKSVVTGALAVGQGGCAEGGTSIEVEGSGTKKSVCNGLKGTTGFTETLPSDKTETGIWSFPEVPEGMFIVRMSFSFPIPLAASIPTSKVHYINKLNEEVKTLAEKVPNTKCLGTAESPSAPAGELCVYEKSGTLSAKFANSSIEGGVNGEGASKVGAILTSLEVSEGSEATGSWAVTAP